MQRGRRQLRDEQESGIDTFLPIGITLMALTRCNTQWKRQIIVKYRTCQNTQPYLTFLFEFFSLHPHCYTR